MTDLAAVERDTTPAEVMRRAAELVTRTLGAADPFQAERHAWFEELLPVQDKLRDRILRAPKPLFAALEAAARSNVFDDETLSAAAIRGELQQVLTGALVTTEAAAFALSDYDLFEADLAGAQSLFFLHDSGPELLFDRLLIEAMVARAPKLRVTSVVRAQPILLDADLDDSERAGLAKTAGVVDVITPGIHTLGLPLNECTREFRTAFESADLVLAKGQAHFETVVGCGKRAYLDRKSVV